MTAAKRKLEATRGVFVLGMHRSGTSATAAALQERGFALGDDLVPAAADNPEGYFEHAAAVGINERLLQAIGRSWHDVRPLPVGWADSGAGDEAAGAIEAGLWPFLESHTPWALKDPRMCRLLPVWRKVLDSHGMRAASLLVLRHPAEVAASLDRRDGLPHVLSCIVWLRHVLEAVQGSRGMPRAILDYTALMKSGGEVLDGALVHLGYPALAEVGALESLRPSLRHNIAGTHRSTMCEPWMRFAIDVYESLRVADDPDAVTGGAIRRFNELHAAQGIDTDAIGQAMERGEARSRRLQAAALAEERRANALQERLDDTDGSLANEQVRSRDRLELAERLQHELDMTQAAFAEEEVRSQRRMAEAEALHQELQSTQAAFAAEEARSQRRMAEAEALHQELQSTQAAFAAEEARSQRRMAEAEALHQELQSTQAAFAAEEARSQRRMAEAEALHQELQSTQAAFAAEEIRSIGRLRQAEALQHAFEAEEARSIAFREEIRVLDSRLGQVSDRLEAVTTTRWWRIREAVAGAWHRIRGHRPDGGTFE